VVFPVADVNIGYKLAPIMEPPSKHFYAAKMSPMAFTGDSVRGRLYDLKSEFCALSIGRRFDVEDVFGVYPNGELCLSLTKDTLQQTGLSTDNKHSAHQFHTVGPALLDITPSSAFVLCFLSNSIVEPSAHI